jgi:hypothetical protein
MRAPATSGARVNHGQARKPAPKKRAAAAASPPAKRKAPAKTAARSRRREPEIKASRGPGTGGTSARKPRRVADPTAETRRQSINSLNAGYGKGGSRGSSRSGARGGSRSSAPTGGSSVRAVAVGAGGAAAGAVRVASEVARPAAAAAARPMLQVITGGLDRLPGGTSVKPFARGRIMIMIAAVLGAGLIYINVGKLEAGDGYGKYAARSAELQRQNIALRARVSQLESPERIQNYAKRFNMVSPLPEQFKYLRTKRGDAQRGAKSYTAPATTGASPTAAPDQQASAPAVTNETPVSGTDTTTPAQTPAPTTPDPAAATVGGAQ